MLPANQGTVAYCIKRNIVWIDGSAMKPTTTWTTVLNANVIPSVYRPSLAVRAKGYFGAFGVGHMTVYMDTSAKIQISAVSEAASADGSFTIIYPI